ncbi:PhzF family phenazine biosynthesis protein [Serratia sp. DD3]|uniref:PhzF family phenazine biosynthesis protein n=1 Tax=Serratia sp. DD3 TaxID=1410619 RepID=UPI0003C4F320|nr:PhzF family phenazine biosynthesis protein [Serratia sp. DD3]KEY57309.1 trans-2,3-dihydro-3-hydroxyanthranilate isomerase [Serratia sp. DD3]
MTRTVAFKQVDVFPQLPFSGNPLAVILDANGLSDDEMAAIARWTHLSETTFVLTPTDKQADYRVRIFTVDGELPFAGHPTLGTAHALLEAGLVPQTASQIVQECGVGLVTIKIDPQGALAFMAPEVVLTPFDDALIGTVFDQEALDVAQAVTIADMGIRWLLVPMISAQAVLNVKPNVSALERLLKHAQVNGLMPFGPSNEGAEQFEVRGLMVEQGALTEDPVTGSANACLAHYFAARGSRDDYHARQGTAIQRYGRITVQYREEGIWIGGQTVTVINGSINL